MIFNAVLERHSQDGLGLAIKRGYPEEWASYGALVVDVLSTGPAYGKLRPGDVIMSVNGVSFEKKSHSEILDLLRRVEGMVNLLVYRSEEMEVSEDRQRVPVGVNSASCQSLFLPDEISSNSQHNELNEPRRIHSMSGFASPQPAPSHAVSLPQLTIRSEDQADALGSDKRQASLLKVNLDKQHSKDGLGVELSSQLVITSVTPGGKADSAGVKAGDRVVNLNGIDAAHLSLIDAAYLMRREQSDVTLMRADPDGDERNVTILPETIQVPVYEKMPYCDHQCCKLQGMFCLVINMLDPNIENNDASILEDPSFLLKSVEPLHVITSPQQYSPVLYRPACLMQRQGAAVSIPNTHICNCHKATPENRGFHPDGEFVEKRTSSHFLNIADDDSSSVYGSESNGNVGTRVVSVQKHPVIGTGIRIIGGNAVGIFVSEVNSQSPGAEAGLKPGEEIISINNEPVKSLTKAEAAAKILKSQHLVRLEVKSSHTKYEAFMNDKLGPGDDFYVRASFNYKPNIMDTNSHRSMDSSVNISALPISPGDIFHVTDSLLAGSFTSWQARKVFPGVSDLGSIPSYEKAVQLLKSQISLPCSTDESKLYLRVVQLDSYPYPRPVIIYGPLADKAMRLLVEEVSTIEDIDGEPRFEAPPISGVPPQQDDIFSCSLTSSSPGVIRLSAIQMSMERGKHPVLNLRPGAIEALISNGITPIVLLITATSAQQIRTVLEMYQPRCPRGGSSIREVSRRLWAEISDLRVTSAHLITDSVLLSSSSDGKFDETEWMHNLISIIRHHQSQPVWIAEDSVAYCKATENLLTPIASPQESSKFKTDVSNYEHGGVAVTTFDTNGGYHGDSSSFGKSSDEWGIPVRLNLIEDNIDLGYSDSNSNPRRKSELRRVRIQSPRSDSRSVQTGSPERTIVEANCVNISPRNEEAGGKHGVGKRHRPLSSRNIPCGLISEPQRVVAEISGEFLPADGGELKIPEHGVELSIPPGAIPDDGTGEKQEIYLRVYEGTNQTEEDGEQDFEKKSHIVSPLIMCGPRGLRFQKPIKLTMPRFHTHSGGSIEPEDSRQYDEKGKAHQSSSHSSSWSLRVMHAATQSDAITTSASASASESGVRSHALRQWRTVRPPLSNIIEQADSSSKPTVASASPIRQLSGTESDGSGAAISYKVEESFISLLIDHF